MHRYRFPVALLVAAAVFVAMFAVLGQATDVVRLVGPAALALLAGVGTLLALSRTAAQARDDAYADDARGQREACLDLVRRIRQADRSVRSGSMHVQVEHLARVVPDLLARLEKASPNAVYSSASQLRGHLESLLGVVTTYAAIEKDPAYYESPQQQLVAGEQAVRRFVDFATDSIRLVNQGDVAAYQANLATVAPPEMPVLGAPGRQEQR